MEKLQQFVNAMHHDNLFALIADEIPYEIIAEYQKNSVHRFRNRNFSLDVTLQAFLYQASQDDKSEQNTVLMIAEYYKRIRSDYEALILESEKKKAEKRTYEKRGRPRREVPRIQKSKLRELSLNTASFDAARQRLPEELLHAAFIKKCEYFQAHPGERTWHNHPVCVTDGTTFKTVDTEELREYLKASEDKNPPPVPMGRMQGIINLYKGGIVAASIGSYGSSEGGMLRLLYDYIPAGTVLLGDDLYSGYGHMACCQSKGIELIAQGKHSRHEKVVKQFTENDVLVEWTAKKRPPWFNDDDSLPPTLTVRRITIVDPVRPEKAITLYTTLLDPIEYPAADIAVLFVSRWEIELSFRNIKIVMKMEYLRGKTPDMVKKEIYAHLLLYNIIRKKMHDLHTPDGAFPPCSSSVQTDIAVDADQTAYVDRLGRCYARKGGRRTQHNSSEVSAKKTAGKTRTANGQNDSGI
jgi:hypothetical protein